MLIDEGVELIKSVLNPVPINEITLTDNKNIEHLYKPSENFMMPSTLEPLIVTAISQVWQEEKEKEEVASNRDETVLKTVTTVNENHKAFIFKTISNFAEEPCETKIDKKELIAAIMLIRRCREEDVDIFEINEMAKRI